MLCAIMCALAVGCAVPSEHPITTSIFSLPLLITNHSKFEEFIYSTSYLLEAGPSVSDGK